MKRPTQKEWAQILQTSVRGDTDNLSRRLLLWAICLNTGHLEETGHPGMGSCLNQVALALRTLKRSDNASQLLAELHRAGLVAGQEKEEHFTAFADIKKPKEILNNIWTLHRWLPAVLKDHPEKARAFMEILLSWPQEAGRLLVALAESNRLPNHLLIPFDRLMKLVIECKESV